LLARAEGAIDETHIIGELGDVVLGRIAGRTSEREITLFESLGLAVEDLAAARLVYDRAVAADAGVVVPFA
jgi:ornithine cyclodeaminase